MNIFEKKFDKKFHQTNNVFHKVPQLKSLTKSGSLRVFVLLSLISVVFSSVNQMKLADLSYISTGIPLFNPELQATFHSMAQIVLFSLTGSFIYTIFRVTVGKYASILAVILYASDSQTILVATSSPFWDFITETFVFSQLLISLAFLKGKEISDIWIIRIAICFAGLIVIYVELLFFQKYKLGLLSRFGYSENHNNFAVVFAVLLVFITSLVINVQMLNQALSSVQKMRYSKFLLKGEVQFLTLAATNMTLSAILGRFSTSALPILLLLASTMIFFRKYKLRQNIYLYLVLSLFTIVLLFQSNFLGSNSIPKTFFFISGLLSAPNLAAGRTHGLVSFPVGFTDTGISNFLGLYPSQISAFSDNLNLLAGFVAENFVKSLEYIVFGWLYADRFMSGSSIGHASLGFTAEYHPIFTMIILALLMVLSLRQSTMILIIVLFLASLLTFSRLEAHQWWYFQLLGFWIYYIALGRILRKLKSFSSNPFLVLAPFFRKLGLLVVGVALVFLTSGFSKMHTNSEVFSRIDAYSDEKWVEFEQKEFSLLDEHSFTYSIFSQMKAMRIFTNAACEHSSIQIQFSKKAETVSNYRATLGGEDTILLPTPAKWYDNAVVNVWKIHRSCDYVVESSNQLDGLMHGLFHSNLGGKPIAHQEPPLEYGSINMKRVEISHRQTAYKAYAQEFLSEHQMLNPLTVPVGTTAEGYMVENLKSLRVEPTQFKSIIISGELNAGTVVFAAKKSPGVYPSIEIIASNRYKPFFQVCMNLHGAEKIEVGRISNQYTFSKLDLRLNPLLGNEKNCHESRYSLPTKVGFMYTLY